MRVRTIANASLYNFQNFASLRESFTKFEKIVKIHKMPLQLSKIENLALKFSMFHCFFLILKPLLRLGDPRRTPYATTPLQTLPGSTSIPPEKIPAGANHCHCQLLPIGC